MKQVKIIADSNYNNLEKKINEFLRREYGKKDADVEIIDSDVGNVYLAVISYYR